MEFGVIMRPKRDGSNHFEENLVSRGDDLMHKKKKIHRLFPINTMGLHVTGGCSDSLAKVENDELQYKH